jgi:hypothetical protein
MDDRAWVATRKGLIELSRRASGWRIARTSFLGEPVSAVLPPDRDGRMLAALNLGHFGTKLHASEDGGATWREVAAPPYPAQPDPPAAGDVAWTLVMVWTLERSLSGAPEVYAGTLPGGLFRSSDLGASWTLDEALWRAPERLRWFGGGYDVPGIHSVLPHPARAGELLVGVSCGGAWRTRDGGASWQVTSRGMRAAYLPPELADDQATQDPHAIARCAASPDALWCQHHNGIWRSTDGAASWVEVTAAPVSSFGFALAAHPHDPGTAWFVPAIADQCRVPRDGALVVNRTRDGGASFETLREGLPQAGCHDLVYRHGLAVAADGRSLLMGSTTGNLWASDDGGERWSLVSSFLPPIHAVRFDAG